MANKKKSKSNKNKKQPSAPPPTTSLAPDTTLGASPANIPFVKAAIASVVASHNLNVQEIIKKNTAAATAAATTTTTTTAATKAPAPLPPEKSTDQPKTVAETTTPATLPKNEQPTQGVPTEETAPASTITTPAPAALVGSHASAAADPRNNEIQRPLPVPKPDDVKTKIAKSKKKCIIL